MNEAPEPSETTRRAKARRWTLLKWMLYSLTVLFVAVVILFLNQFRDVPIRISTVTTILTEPLDANGFVDYPKAFKNNYYSENIATSDNGFRLLVANIDNLYSNVPRPVLAKICSDLGLELGSIRPKLTYEEPYDEAFKYYGSKDYDPRFIRQLEWERKGETGDKSKVGGYDNGEASSEIVDRSYRPWTEKDLPMLVRWVDTNSSTLDLVAKAVRMKTFEIPFVVEDDYRPLDPFSGYHTPNLRSLARGFLTRANFYVGNGETRKAVDDIISCKRLGRHVRNRNTFFCEFWGGAMESLANSTGFLNLENDTATAEDLAYFANELRSLPKLSSIEKSVFHAKLMGLDWLTDVARNGSNSELNRHKDVRYLRNLGLNWNTVLQEYSKEFDEIWKYQELLSGGGKSELKFFASYYFSREYRSKRFATWFAIDHVVGFRNVTKTRNSITCSDQLREMTLAMLRYEKDHGTLPPAFTVNENGKVLHCWRVLLLPYLGEQKLFEQLRLDEPWDSPHNLRIGETCPDVFQCPSCQDCSPRQTYYSIVIGKGLPFSGSKGTHLDDFGPESEDMILIVERTDPVHWMDPSRELKRKDVDIGFNMGDDYDLVPSRVAGRHDLYPQFGFRNGSAYSLPRSLDPDVIESLLLGVNKIKEIY